MRLATAISYLKRHQHQGLKNHSKIKIAVRRAKMLYEIVLGPDVLHRKDQCRETKKGGCISPPFFLFIPKNIQLTAFTEGWQRRNSPSKASSGISALRSATAV